MKQKYPTDLTDEQWAKIAPLFNGVRNRVWSKRDLVDAVLYLFGNNCTWRNLPNDFPAWKTVYTFYRRAKISGLWDNILQILATESS